MKLYITAFTAAGAGLARRLCGLLQTETDLTVRDVRVTPRHAENAGLLPMEGPLSDWAAEAFLQGDALVFIGATGIAVRTVAPFVRDKRRDPAVLAIDEQARFVIPLLSGHVGGANALAVRLAKLLGAQAAISTATDLCGRFAVDVWAREHGVVLCEYPLAKAVSAALLDGGTVGVHSRFPLEGALPRGLQMMERGELGISVDLNREAAPFTRTLHAIPRIVTVGAGCRKGVSPGVFEETVLKSLGAHGIAPEALCCLASVDRKAGEECMNRFAEKYGIPFLTAEAQSLQAVEGEFAASAFVEQTVGVDNVCERAALWAGGGRLLFHKESANAVTVAAAAKKWGLRLL